MKFGINQVHCTAELSCINEIVAIGHPKGIARHVTADIDYRTAYCHFDFLYLIEYKADEVSCRNGRASSLG